MSNSNINLEEIRDQFPSLKRKIGKYNIVFFDGPGGTQMPNRVIRAISSYYRYYNSNTHGQFRSSIQTDHIIDTARKSISSLIGAEGPHCISIGQNMTSLNFALSRGFTKIFKPGDEVLITQLDHEANRGPWLTLRDSGITVREVRINQVGMLDEDDFRSKVNENTKLIAIGYASNVIGNVNNIPLARKLAYDSGALLLIDAVHYVPHFPLDVGAICADLLLCSAYKFYGPHIGFLYARPGILDRIPTERLRTQYQHAPYRIESGTLNHASLAGVNAVIAFLSSFGEGKTSREKLVSAMTRINEKEQKLARKLYEGIKSIKKIRIIGPDYDQGKRAPTISFIHQDLRPDQVCRKLGEKGISAWDGHFYAIRLMEILGLLESGGVTRLGISMYNNESDLDKVLEILKKI